MVLLLVWLVSVLFLCCLLCRLSCSCGVMMLVLR